MADYPAYILSIACLILIVQACLHSHIHLFLGKLQFCLSKAVCPHLLYYLHHGVDASLRIVRQQTDRDVEGILGISEEESAVIAVSIHHLRVLHLGEFLQSLLQHRAHQLLLIIFGISLRGSPFVASHTVALHV